MTNSPINPAEQSEQLSTAPVAPKKSKKSETEQKRDFLLSLGIHEADAIAACINIGASNAEMQQVKGSDRHRLNLYLNAGSNSKSMTATQLSAYRMSRARQLINASLPFLDKSEMAAAMFTVNEIAQCQKDIEAGVKMIQFYNSES